MILKLCLTLDPPNLVPSHWDIWSFSPVSFFLLRCVELALCWWLMEKAGGKCPQWMLFGNSCLTEHTGIHIHTVWTEGRKTELVQRVAVPPVQINRKSCGQRSLYQQAWMGVCKPSLLCEGKDQSLVIRVYIRNKWCSLWTISWL